MDFKSIEDRVNESYENTRDKIGYLSRINEINHSESEIFVIVFRELFIGKSPLYIDIKGKRDAMASNWTYHTAFCLKEAAELLWLDCQFEVEGRRDGIIVSRENPPVAKIIIEWEWDYLEVFERGKQLEKIINTVKKYKDCTSALLLTFCPLENFADFSQRVVAHWQKEQSLADKNFYLCAALTLPSPEKKEFFVTLRTLEIYKEQVFLWEDRDFDWDN
ncbi:MAG: hypothetical protein NZ521_03080 [Flammeovirgaceae bacterium]|nr:hypothetical protein [Flammeovirgaceae bacterium]MDW8287149.1 hypothetical protein [Flammeovirgaceae bacterium]